MKTTRSLNLLSATLTAALALTFTANAADITPAETKAIAEEGFIYGLPIVMNYGVMYEYAVDKNSGQYKAPFNQINNEARVFTYKDTSVITPNSDTPYSILWTDLRAEPIVLSVPAVDLHKNDKELAKTGFFDYLAFALQFAPAEPQEKEIREKLPRLGIEAGKTFAFKDLSPEQQAQMVAGVKDGEAKIKQYLESGQKNISGWKVG